MDKHDDIVARLRESDGGYFVRKMFTEAADEIERLRAGGCARDQRTTQFCAEAAAMQSEIERLRKELRAWQDAHRAHPDEFGGNPE